MSTPTLTEVERLVDQLPSTEQLKLAARICDKLAEGQQEQTATPGVVDAKRLAEIDAWLAECDAVAESIEGEFDSAKEIREIREERANRL